MPELPEVETVRRNLERVATGKTVRSFRVVTPEIILQGNPADLIGMTFACVERKGKYLIMPTDGHLTLTAHLGMSGMFIWSGDVQQEPSHVRAVIGFDDGLLYFRDIRRLKGLWIHDNSALVWNKLGPDAISEECTPEHLRLVFTARRRDIKQLLLDQSLIAGIGNIYASEILYRAGIAPTRSGNSLQNKEIFALHSAIMEVLLSAVAAGGTTLRDYRLSDGRAGEFRQYLAVYGRAGEPCLKCGAEIHKIVQGQRSSYFCSGKSCQR